MEIITQSHTNAEKIILQRKFTLNRVHDSWFELNFWPCRWYGLQISFYKFQNSALVAYSRCITHNAGRGC